jgi:hypothetical protein
MSDTKKVKKTTIKIGTVKMDEKNKEAINILFTKGEKVFMEKVFTGDNGERLSYSDMRSRYG